MTFTYQFVEFRGYDDLELALQRLALKLSPQTSLIVGVPRSGLMAAAMLALQLNLPFTDLEGYLDGRVLATGRRSRPDASAGQRRDVVILDDSVLTGNSMREVRTHLDASALDDEVTFAAAFAAPESLEHIDAYGEILRSPRIFAWNILHHPQLMERACLDIDGVLCRDPLQEENDDGERYREFIVSAQPLFLPSSPIGSLVTSRLERYRPETEQWLERHGIQYERLVMLEGVDAATRRRLGLHASHKAKFYAESGAELFIESDFSQAEEIARLSGRQVFSIDRRVMVYPRLPDALRRAPRELFNATTTTPQTALRRKLRSGLGRGLRRRG